MTTSQLLIQHLFFRLPFTDVNFADVSMTFESSKYGIVGENGVGKTTFLKLLSGELPPDKGLVQRGGSIVIVPQSHSEIPSLASIEDVLGISEILAALLRIKNGVCEKNDFDLVSDQWDMESKITSALDFFNLSSINLKDRFATLSGGTKTKILLARMIIFSNDFILMDEPTNNLDKTSREILYQFIETYQKGMIIISHDRTLLNKMDHMIEITQKGIHSFGGNYDFYCEQKALQLESLHQDLLQAKRQIKQAHQKIQSTREKHAQLASRGKKAFREGKVDKLTARSKKGRSEKTKSRMTTQEGKILSDKQSALEVIKEKIEIKEQIDRSLQATSIANGKMILEIENLEFKYPNQSFSLFKNFNLKIMGPKRIAITGPNGSGKSTLIKLIKQQLIPLNGAIKLALTHLAYLDQEVNFLDKNLTLIDNFLKLNPNATAFDAYFALSGFKFKNHNAEKKVADLSGGERVRAGLAIRLMSTPPPQLILLDEPTNHLDLASIEIIESMLRLFQGAVIAISHDEKFLENIGITETIDMTPNKPMS